MQQDEISLLVGGEAGQGINAAGFLLAKSFFRGGLDVFGSIDYPSLIRGGHNFYTLRAAVHPVYSHWDTINLVIALDALTMKRHQKHVSKDGGYIYDSDRIPADHPDVPTDKRFLFPIPLKTLQNEIEGTPVIRNVIALGATLAVLDYDVTILEEILWENFQSKGDKVVEMNHRAVRAGYDYAKKNFSNEFTYQIKAISKTKQNRILIPGSEAIALGAMAAGCKFYSAYPMTPSSGVLHFFFAQGEQFGIVTQQPESEIAAINMAIGAAHAGVRAMTGTSGGGFCLMTEAFSLAGMTETPLVVMLGQRTGPSTGLPTYTGQSDLLFAIHASHGEFPRIVLAPGDVQEAFDLTIDAFSLAEQFQLPVIILTDKHLLESHYTNDTFKLDNVHIDRGKLLPMTPYKGKEPYLRHQYTDDGISPRLIPGTPGALVHTDSAVHKESGFQGDHCEIAEKQANKRYQKMPTLLKTLLKRDTIKIHGPHDAKTTIVSWGSPKGAILEALRILHKENESINFTQILYLEPFPVREVEKALQGKHLILVENNQTGQLASLIQQYTDYKIDQRILRYDGRPFDPVDLTARIREALK